MPKNNFLQFLPPASDTDNIDKKTTVSLNPSMLHPLSTRQNSFPGYYKYAHNLKCPVFIKSANPDLMKTGQKEIL
ncbi:MAG: hypothetical protein ACHQIM_11980 [Sphingobacteriales bacterium]